MTRSTKLTVAILVGVALLLAGGYRTWLEWEQREMLEAFYVTALDDRPEPEVIMFRDEFRSAAVVFEPYGSNWLEAFDPVSGSVQWTETVDFSPTAPTNSKVFGRYEDRIVVPRSGGTAYAYDLEAREVAWTIDLEQVDDRAIPYRRSFIFAPDRILVRRRTEQGLRLSSHNLKTGAEQWEIPGAEIPGFLGKESFAFAADRIVQRTDPAIGEPDVRLIDRETGDLRELRVWDIAVTDRRVLYSDEQRKLKPSEFAGWTPPGDETDGEATDRGTEDADQNPRGVQIRPVLRAGPDPESSETLRLDGKPVGVPASCNRWVVRRNRLLCTHEPSERPDWATEGEPVRGLYGIPLEPDASAYSIPYSNHLRSGACVGDPYPGGATRLGLGCQYPARYALLETPVEGESLHGHWQFVDLQKGTTLAELPTVPGYLQSRYVTSDGLELLLLAEGETEAEWFDDHLLLAFDGTSGRIRHVAHLREASSGDPIPFVDISMDEVHILDHYLVSRGPYTDDVWVLDFSEMKLVYGPTVEIEDRTTAFRDRFEGLPIEKK